MELGEKLQELRKRRGMTQEELAESLYVSRTAVSKWESGRGCPGIESLKEISSFFDVTIDELLSGEKLLSIAEKENKSNLQKVYDLFFGIADVFAVLLVILPLYPDTVNGYVYSISLLYYTESPEFNRIIYWVTFLSLIILGVIKIVLTGLKIEKGRRAVKGISVGLGIFSVLFLALGREAYAVVVAFLLLSVKALLIIKEAINGR